MSDLFDDNVSDLFDDNVSGLFDDNVSGLFDDKKPDVEYWVSEVGPGDHVVDKDDENLVSHRSFIFTTDTGKRVRVVLEFQEYFSLGLNLCLNSLNEADADKLMKYVTDAFGVKLQGESK